MLVHGAQTGPTARAYAGLPFECTRFDTVFETSPLDLTAKIEPAYPLTAVDGLSLGSASTDPIVNDLTRTVSRSSFSSTSEAPGLTPLAPISVNGQSTVQKKASTPPTEVALPKPVVSTTPKRAPGSGTGEGKNGIPINRHGQRVDLKMRIPTDSELLQFEKRIKHRKLCNEHHLRDNCESYNCKYDHEPIDATMRNTLRYKARSIPCGQGSTCRRQDCFYGHQCPWGNNECGNFKCSFIKMGLHDIKDLEVARYVAAAPAALA